MTKDRKIRLLLIVFGSAVFLLFTPIVSFVFNAGSIIGMLMGVVLIVIGIFFNKLKEKHKHFYLKKTGKIITWAVVACLAVSFICICALSVKIFSFMNDDTVKNAPVIVLGCKVNGTTPSIMLQKRIDAAYDYRIENEEAVCIASGGQGKDEDISEAQAIANSLIEKGISYDRIILEDTSTSTEENLDFSKKKLEENGLGDTAVIVTTDYHQYRVSLIAEKIGLETYSISSHSKPFSIPTTVLRECFVIILFFLGY